MDNLPDDILTRILVRVPCFKSFLRCTSVCKPWYSCIKSPAFITLHRFRPNITKFLFWDTKNSESSEEARYLMIHGDPGTLSEKYILVFPHKLTYQIVIYGCCEGLICYSCTNHLTFGNSPCIYLWNPAIRKLKALPRFPKYNDYDRFSYTHSGFGFWFDKGVNDYMVAKIFSTGEAFVYGLRTNSWKLISESIPAAGTTDEQFELAYVAGTLHWPANISGNWMIYSLNIESGLFRDTLISCGRSDKKLLSDVCLTPLGEHSLAVFEFSNSEDSSRLCCCMVQVYDKNLNKLYTINVEKDTFYHVRLAGSRNNEALITKFKRDSNVCEMVSWNTDRKCFSFNEPTIVSWNTDPNRFKSYVQNIGPKEHGGLYYGCMLRGVRPFIETLALLNDRDAEETSCPNYQLNLKTISTT